MAAWRIEGEYMETCNCSFLCPCISSNMKATPTEGDCKAAVALRISRGQKDGVALDGLSFIIVMRSPMAMAEGDMTVGLIVDETADDKQAAALTEIATGAAGGPMAAFAALIGEFAGVEKRPITFETDGLNRKVTAGDLIAQSLAGVPSATRKGEPIYIDNTVHPVSSRLALAKATESRFSAFGIDWSDASGARNGHFAPFAWQA